MTHRQTDGRTQPFIVKDSCHIVEENLNHALGLTLSTGLGQVFIHVKMSQICIESILRFCNTIVTINNALKIKMHAHVNLSIFIYF